MFATQRLQTAEPAHHDVAGLATCEFVQMNAPRRVLPLLVASLMLCGMPATAEEPKRAAQPHQVATAEVLARLEDGNRRYMAGKLMHPRQDARRRAELATEQHPFAIVLGCSDSRTSPEVLFDQGLGDLFVVRVAGNVLNDQILGSIEYAVEHLGTQVVVVLGHERCGAVKATKETLAAKAEAPPHINSLVSAIRPAVEAAPGADVEAMTHANIRYVVQGLRSSAPTLKGKVDAREIAVVGAYYDLDTGKVVFLKDSQAE